MTLARYNLLYDRQMAHLDMLNELTDSSNRVHVTDHQRIHRYLKNIDLPNITITPQFHPERFSTLGDAMKEITKVGERAALFSITAAQQQFKHDHNGNTFDMLSKGTQLGAASSSSETTSAGKDLGRDISGLGISQDSLFGKSRHPTTLQPN